MPTTLGIIDDSELFARTLRRLADREPGLETVIHVLSGAELPALLAAAPELVFLDLNLCDASGLDLLPALRRELPDAAVIVLTAQYGSDVAEAARAGGARACFTKDHLVPLLRTIARDGLDALRSPAPEIGRVFDR